MCVCAYAKFSIILASRRTVLKPFFCVYLMRFVYVNTCLDYCIRQIVSFPKTTRTYKYIHGNNDTIDFFLQFKIYLDVPFRFGAFGERAYSFVGLYRYVMYISLILDRYEIRFFPRLIPKSPPLVLFYTTPFAHIRWNFVWKRYRRGLTRYRAYLTKISLYTFHIVLWINKYVVEIFD